MSQRPLAAFDDELELEFEETVDNLVEAIKLASDDNERQLRTRALLDYFEKRLFDPNTSYAMLIFHHIMYQFYREFLVVELWEWLRQVTPRLHDDDKGFLISSCFGPIAEDPDAPEILEDPPPFPMNDVKDADSVERMFRWLESKECAWAVFWAYEETFASLPFPQNLHRDYAEYTARAAARGQTVPPFPQEWLDEWIREGEQAE